MNLFVLILQPFIYLVVLILLVVIVLPMSIFAMPFSKYTRFKLTAPSWYLFFNLCLKFVMLTKHYSDDRREEASRKTITPQGLYIGNHQSFMDIPLNYSHMIIPPIMKKSIMYIPIFGICAYSSGSIAVDRNDPESRKKVFAEATRRLLSDFKQIQYYPEGTRNKSSSSPKDVSQIKTKLMRFAYDNNVPVYPMSLYGTDMIIRNKLIFPGQQVGIILHEAVQPKDFSDVESFIHFAWDKVIKGHQELTAKFTRE